MMRACPRLGVVVLMVLSAGCGRGTGNVSGTVKFKGQPLPTGTITFYDAANGAISSPINEDGSFEVKKVAAGAARITVTMPMPIAFQGPAMPGAKTVVPTAVKKTPSLPQRYLDPEQSGLRYEVVRGNQKHDFDLQP